MTWRPQTAVMATMAPDHGPREVGSAEDDVVVAIGDVGDHLCVAIAGDLDIVGAQVLRIVAEPRVVRSRRPLVIDVERVAFCDVAGLTALLSLRDVAVANGCEVRLRRPSARLRWLMALTGTTGTFAVSAC